MAEIEEAYLNQRKEPPFTTEDLSVSPATQGFLPSKPVTNIQAFESGEAEALVKPSYWDKVAAEAGENFEDSPIGVPGHPGRLIRLGSEFIDDLSLDEEPILPEDAKKMLPPGMPAISDPIKPSILSSRIARFEEKQNLRGYLNRGPEFNLFDNLLAGAPLAVEPTNVAATLLGGFGLGKLGLSGAKLLAAELGSNFLENAAVEFGSFFLGKSLQEEQRSMEQTLAQITGSTIAGTGISKAIGFGLEKMKLRPTQNIENEIKVAQVQDQLGAKQNLDINNVRQDAIDPETGKVVSERELPKRLTPEETTKIIDEASNPANSRYADPELDAEIDVQSKARYLETPEDHEKILQEQLTDATKKVNAINDPEIKADLDRLREGEILDSNTEKGLNMLIDCYKKGST